MMDPVHRGTWPTEHWLASTCHCHRGGYCHCGVLPLWGGFRRGRWHRPFDCAQGAPSGVEGRGGPAIGEEGRMHIVLVLVTVKPELLEEFEQSLLHNARESVARDPGCVRFDVSQQQDDPARWVLYEVYESPDAHAVHRRSPHFLAYDAVASRALVDKTVIRASGKYPA